MGSQAMLSTVGCRQPGVKPEVRVLSPVDGKEELRFRAPLQVWNPDPWSWRGGGMVKIHEMKVYPFVHRVWNHDFHHPFWGTIIFGNTHIIIGMVTLQASNIDTKNCHV